MICDASHFFISISFFGIVCFQIEGNFTVHFNSVGIIEFGEDAKYTGNIERRLNNLDVLWIYSADRMSHRIPGLSLKEGSVWIRSADRALDLQGLVAAVSFY